MGYVVTQAGGAVSDGYVDGAMVLGVDSDLNTITGNVVLGEGLGLVLYFSQYNTILDNNFQQCGVIVYSNQLDDWNTHTMNNNTANGLPIRYYKDVAGVTVPGPAAQVILANCTNMILQQISTADVDVAIQLGLCSDCLVQGNTITNAITGVSLISSNDKTK